MAVMEFDLRTYLLAQAAVTALASTRVYWVKLPQNTLFPAVLMARLNGGHAHRVSGGAGRAQPTVEILSLAETYYAARNLAETIRGELQGYSGTMGAGTEVTAVTLDDERDEYEEPQDGSDAGIFIVTQHWQIQYRESIPTPS